MVLNQETIRELIKDDGLIVDYVNLDTQLQGAGFDLTLRDVYYYINEGRVDFDNRERRIAKTKKIKPDNEEWYFLGPGAYKIQFNEGVKMPTDVVAIARTRSTLLRNGAFIDTGVWDPGFGGRSFSLLVVRNPHGIHIKKYSRVVQLVFFRCGEAPRYDGVYNYELFVKDEEAENDKVIRPKDTE